MLSESDVVPVQGKESLSIESLSLSLSIGVFTGEKTTHYQFQSCDQMGRTSIIFNPVI